MIIIDKKATFQQGKKYALLTVFYRKKFDRWEEYIWGTWFFGTSFYPSI
jgi:hypothetical protein